jgi:hypothetical protein
MVLAGLEKVVAGCPTLASLNLSGCENLTDAGLGNVAAVCPNLIWVDGTMGEAAPFSWKHECSAVYRAA